MSSPKPPYRNPLYSNKFSLREGYAHTSSLDQPQAPPTAEPPNHRERRIVNHHRTLRDRIHDGPFYTILDSGARISKDRPGRAASPAAAHFDPFEGAETYSQRFVKKKNTLPKLATRPFVKELFPRELWATLDPSFRVGDVVNGMSAPGAAEKEGAAATEGKKKKVLQLQTKTKADRWAALAEEGNDEDGEGAEDDAAEDGEDKEGEDQDADEDDPDQFDEEDEDMDDDYNAENYFDGGDDDDYGGDEGGGGDDDNY